MPRRPVGGSYVPEADIPIVHHAIGQPRLPKSGQYDGTPRHGKQSGVTTEYKSASYTPIPYAPELGISWS